MLVYPVVYLKKSFFTSLLTINLKVYLFNFKVVFKKVYTLL